MEFSSSRLLSVPGIEARQNSFGELGMAGIGDICDCTPRGASILEALRDLLPLTRRRPVLRVPVRLSLRLHTAAWICLHLASSLNDRFRGIPNAIEAGTNDSKWSHAITSPSRCRSVPSFHLACPRRDHTPPIGIKASPVSSGHDIRQFRRLPLRRGSAQSAISGSAPDCRDRGWRSTLRSQISTWLGHRSSPPSHFPRHAGCHQPPGAHCR